MTREVVKRAICVIGIVLLAISLPTGRAAAEPIATATITGGSILEQVGFSDLDLTGTQGFSLHGSWESSHPECVPCEVGDTVNLSGNFGGSAETGSTGTFRGQTYAFDFNHGGARLQIDTAMLTLPPAPPGNTAQFTVPFRLRTSGDSFSFVSFDPGDGTPLFDVAVRGSGTATLFTDIFRNPGIGPQYNFKSARYDFTTPTPEPGSLILIGTGIVAGCWRRHRRLHTEQI